MGRLKRTLALASALGCGGAALGAQPPSHPQIGPRWVVVDEGATARLAVDTTRLSRHGANGFVLWVRADFTESDETYQEFSRKGARRALMQFVVDCDRAQVGVGYSGFYTTEGKFVSGGGGIDDAEMTEVAPESTGELIMRAACRGQWPAEPVSG